MRRPLREEYLLVGQWQKFDSDLEREGTLSDGRKEWLQLLDTVTEILE